MNWPFHFTKSSVLQGGTLMAAEQSEPRLLHQLQTRERPEEFVRWDLVRLYSSTARQNQAFVHVQHLVETAETFEKKAAYHLATGQLMEQQQNFVCAAMCFIRAVQTNAANPRALRRLEALLEEHPEVRQHIPDFELHLMASRKAVERVTQTRRQSIKRSKARTAVPERKPSWLAGAKHIFASEKHVSVPAG
jgi:hypothetical protein